MIFDYPLTRTVRRHGPAGYSNYESFRPWLRDEFTFRCVYCLKRETWGQVSGDFDIDHFEPQSVTSEGKLDYFNLVYACHRCNLVKQGRRVPDPFRVLVSTNVRCLADGSLVPANSEAVRLVRLLDLNSPNAKSWRRMWMKMVELAEADGSESLQRLIGFPTDLPNLATRRPPQNRMPEGISESWFEQRRRGTIPASY